MIDPATFRVCTHCRAVGNPTEDFYAIRDARCRERRRPDSWCKRCRIRAQRERRDRARTDPDTLRAVRAREAAWARAWRVKNPERERQLRRAAEARLSADPERLALRAEAARMNHRIRQQARGVSVRKTPKGRRHYRESLAPEEFLAPEPLLAWLAETFGDLCVAEVARRLRVSERWLRALYGREYQRLTLLAVDRAFTNYGRPDLLEVLYPLESR